jgi:3' exoribonuclease, RNase T-like
MDNRLYIFLDTEFTSLSRSTKLISLGLTVLSNRRESFYAEFNDFSMLHTSEFVKEQVLPKMVFYPVQEDMQRDGMRMILMKNATPIIKHELISWLKDLHKKYNKRLTFVVDVGTYDWLLFSELISIPNADNQIIVPDYVDYIPIDVSTMLYLAGYDTDISRNELLGVNRNDGNIHNALYDSKLTHMLYAMLMNKFFGEEGELYHGKKS